MITRYEYTDRGRLALRGADRVRFLHGMVTCDVEKLTDGGGSRAAMLSVKGRLLAELTIYVTADELLLSVDVSLFEKVRALLDKHIVMDDVELLDRSAELRELGVYGDEAIACVARAIGLDEATLAALHPYHHVATGAVRVARDPSLAGVGFRLFGAPEAMSALVLPGALLSADERELARIEAGTARYGADLDEERLVVEANLEDAISFDKGCYLGQEVVVRATTRGRVNRKLVGLTIDGEGLPAPRTKLTSEAQPEAGLITSAAFSVRKGGVIALGYVHRAAIDAGKPIMLKGTDRQVHVVELPFAERSL